MCKTLVRPVPTLALLVLALFALPACGDYAFGGGELSSGDLGATPGGAQDIRYARTLIDTGSVPAATTITVEGLLSEHSIPTAGGPCEDIVCARPSIGRAPSLRTGQMEWWVQIGMQSGLSADFERPPMDLVVLIDRSSSMQVDMEETAESVVRILDELTPRDRLSVITFGNAVEHLVTFDDGADHDEVVSRLRGIRARGAFNLLDGLDAAYAEARRMGPSDDRLSRVILLSCGSPSVSNSRTTPFSGQVRSGAADGIGFTFVGVLLGFDTELAEMLSVEPGGNYYYTSGLEQTEAILEENFDLMVTPLAYDVDFALTTGEDFEVREVFGIPGEEGATSTSFSVGTLFPHRGGGAIVAQLDALVDEPRPEVGTVELSYTPETALGWTESTHRTLAIAAAPADDELPYFEHVGVRKAVALVNMAHRMQDAADLFHDGEASAARSILDELSAYLATEAEALADADLAAEVELVEQMRANMD